MSDERRKRPKRKKSGPSVALVAALVVVPVLLLGGCGVFGVVVALASGGVIGGRVGEAFALPDSRATRANYEAVPMGASLAQAEATLGRGRPATSRDFEAIFGKPGDSPLDRANSHGPAEENRRLALTRAWANGSTRIVLTFHKPPESGGRLVGKCMVGPDGVVSMQMNTGVGQFP